MPAFIANFLNPISAFVMAIFMAFYNLFGGWFGFIEETPEIPDVGSPEHAVTYETEDPAIVAAVYNEASDKTRDDGIYPAGHQTMELVGEITGDGAIGTILEVLNPIVSDVLADNSTSTDYIPGWSRGELKASDIAYCYMAEYTDGCTYVYIELYDQVDGPDCDGHEAGPVARGIGTIGSIDTALEALGAQISSGRDSVSLTYYDAYIDCFIDSDGYITEGVWHYLVEVNVLDAKARLSIITANLKNLNATIEYTVEVG